MTKSSFGKPYVAAIIESHDNLILIARLPKDQNGEPVWCFPRGRASDEETPEAAMRRTTRNDLGIDVEIVVGQPPLQHKIDGELANLRYFFCGVTATQDCKGPYADLRWVPRHHLREYEFDEPSRPVVDWLLEADM